MAYAALAVVTLLAAGVIGVLVQDGRRRERAFARVLAAQADERRQLLDRIMHMKGMTWALPPVEETIPEPEEPTYYPELLLEDEL